MSGSGGLRVKAATAGSAERLDGNHTRAVPSVKANLVLGPWYDTELFANFGTGFHSNDARAVVLDPRMPALPQARPRARGQVEDPAACGALRNLLGPRPQE